MQSTPRNASPRQGDGSPISRGWSPQAGNSPQGKKPTSPGRDRHQRFANSAGWAAAGSSGNPSRGGSHASSPERRDIITPGSALPSNTAPIYEELLIPPLNFGRVCRGVYRSGFPGRKNFLFLKKLGLSSVLNLSEHVYPPETVEFFECNGITSKSLSVNGNKEPFVVSDEDVIREALHLVLDATPDRPLLVHCTKGTHRTGCVVGCLRKLEGWSLTPIFDEYRRFAGTKVHLLDQQFIEFFTPTQEHVDKEVSTRLHR